MTVHEEVEYLVKATDIGVDGYILKDSESSELKKAINAVINGEKESGITTMMTDVGMDTGDILIADKCEISENMTMGDIDKALKESSALIQRLQQVIDAFRQEDDLLKEINLILKEHKLILQN